MRIAQGLTAPFRGALFVVKHRLWGPIVWPAALSALLAVVVASVVLREARSRWAVLAGHGFFAIALVALAFLALVALAFLVLQPLVSAPFTDHLTERVEKLVRGGTPRASLLRSAAQSLAHGGLKSACYLLALTVTSLLGIATGAGGALGVGLLVAFLAYDGFDYPLARRGVSFAGKWRFLARHPGLSLGYGAAALVMQLFPLSFLLAPALSAAGATIVFLELEPAAYDDALGPRATPGSGARRSA